MGVGRGVNIGVGRAGGIVSLWPRAEGRGGACVWVGLGACYFHVMRLLLLLLPPQGGAYMDYCVACLSFLCTARFPSCPSPISPVAGLWVDLDLVLLGLRLWHWPAPLRPRVSGWFRHLVFPHAGSCVRGWRGLHPGSETILGPCPLAPLRLLAGPLPFSQRSWVLFLLG